MNETILRLNNEAGSWDNGSPIGGGSFGAVLFGGAKTEKIYLNEETIWSESPMAPPDPEFRNKIQRLRDMYLAGETYIDDEAERLLGDSMQCVKSYESAGVVELCLPEFGEVKHYKRELDLEHAVFSCAAQYACGTVKEEAFCSYPYEITAVKYTFPAAGSVKIAFTREFTDAVEYNGGVLEATCHTGYGNHRFAVGVKPLSDGAVSFADGCLRVENAKTLTLFIAIATEYNYGDGFLAELREILVEAEDYAAIKANHIEDFAALFHESSVSFAEADPSLRRKPAGERIARLRDDPAAVDPGLYELYFNFGKYLLISSSREGTLPANLQGVWAEKLENPWNADYHTNINLQMNYWPAYVTDLADPANAFLQFVASLRKPGRLVAAKTLGVGSGSVDEPTGWVAHTQLSPLGMCGPGSSWHWGWEPVNGAWAAAQMYDCYAFTGDLQTLKETIYPTMEESARLFSGLLCEEPNTGRLVFGPGSSPEHGPATLGCTYDQTILYALFDRVIEAAAVLETHGCGDLVDRTLVNTLKTQKDRLQPLQIGKHGTIREWAQEDDFPRFGNPYGIEKQHRHLSHLLGLYPFGYINDTVPELQTAARASLKARGDKTTGWAMAHRLCCWARLRDGNQCDALIAEILKTCIMKNLFGTHPPFQIDGNFGFTAGVAEMLLQSHEGVIRILPALPKDWHSGSFRGLRARGGIVVGAVWKNDRLKEGTVCAPNGGTVRLSYDGKIMLVQSADGTEVETDFENGVTSFEAKAGETYTFS